MRAALPLGHDGLIPTFAQYCVSIVLSVWAWKPPHYLMCDTASPPQPCNITLTATCLPGEINSSNDLPRSPCRLWNSSPFSRSQLCLRLINSWINNTKHFSSRSVKGEKPLLVPFLSRRKLSYRSDMYKIILEGSGRSMKRTQFCALSLHCSHTALWCLLCNSTVLLKLRFKFHKSQEIKLCYTVCLLYIFIGHGLYIT